MPNEANHWLFAGIALILGVILTKGTDSLLKVLKARTDDKRGDVADIVSGYKLAVEQLNHRVVTLEGLLADSQARERECIKEQERLRGLFEGQTKQIETLDKEVRTLRERFHNIVDPIHAKTLADQLARDEADTA